MDSEFGKRPIGELLRAMATGSENDFRDFVKDALPDMEKTLRGVFRRHGINESWIDDLVQDTMLKVIETLRRNPSQSVTIAWLFMVAKSVRIDRTRRVQREVPANDELLTEATASESNIEESWDLKTMLSKLKDDDKSILKMIY